MSCKHNKTEAHNNTINGAANKKLFLVLIENLWFSRLHFSRLILDLLGSGKNDKCSVHTFVRSDASFMWSFKIIFLFHHFVAKCPTCTQKNVDFITRYKKSAFFSFHIRP